MRKQTDMLVPEWLRAALSSSAPWYEGLEGDERDVMQMFAVLAAMRGRLQAMYVGRLADIALSKAQESLRDLAARIATVSQHFGTALTTTDYDLLDGCVLEDRDHGEPMLPREGEDSAIERLQRAGLIFVDASGAYVPTDKGRLAAMCVRVLKTPTTALVLPDETLAKMQATIDDPAEPSDHLHEAARRHKGAPLRVREVSHESASLRPGDLEDEEDLRTWRERRAKQFGIRTFSSGSKKP